jgi:hypothetical protein
MIGSDRLALSHKLTDASRDIALIDLVMTQPIQLIGGRLELHTYVIQASGQIGVFGGRPLSMFLSMMNYIVELLVIFCLSASALIILH